MDGKNKGKAGDSTENLEPVETDVLTHVAADLGISGLKGLEDSEDEGKKKNKSEDEDEDGGEGSEGSQADTDEDEEAQEEEDLENGEEEDDEDGVSEEGEDDEAEESDTDDEESEGKLDKKLQEKIDKRIGKEVAKRKTAEEKLTATKTERDKLSEELSDLRLSINAGSSGLHPMFLVDSENDIDKRESEIMAFRAWARKNKHGYEGDGTPQDPSYSAEQIEDRLEQLEDERQVILPRARKIVAERAKMDSHVKTLYPDLLDPGSDDSQIMQAILRQVPGLKRLPNVKVVIGDMLAGERLRKKSKKKAKSGTSTEKAPKAPKVPDGSGPRGQGPLSKKKKKGGDHKGAVKEFVESGGSTENLEKVILAGNFV